MPAGRVPGRPDPVTPVRRCAAGRAPAPRTRRPPPRPAVPRRRTGGARRRRAGSSSAPRRSRRIAARSIGAVAAGSAAAAAERVVEREAGRGGGLGDDLGVVEVVAAAERQAPGGEDERRRHARARPPCAATRIAAWPALGQALGPDERQAQLGRAGARPRRGARRRADRARRGAPSRISPRRGLPATRRASSARRARPRGTSTARRGRRRTSYARTCGRRGRRPRGAATAAGPACRRSIREMSSPIDRCNDSARTGSGGHATATGESGPFDHEPENAGLDPLRSIRLMSSVARGVNRSRSADIGGSPSPPYLPRSAIPTTSGRPTPAPSISSATSGRCSSCATSPAGPAASSSSSACCPGISTEQLRSRLNRMVADGLLTRQRYREVPPRVDYELTERARDLLPVIGALRRWGYRWAWGPPRPGEAIDVGAILRCAPGLEVPPTRRAARVELVVTRGGRRARTSTSCTSATARVTYRGAQRPRRPTPTCIGPERAWVEAFGTDGSRTELEFAGDARLAEAVLDEVVEGVHPQPRRSRSSTSEADRPRGGGAGLSPGVRVGSAPLLRVVGPVDVRVLPRVAGRPRRRLLHEAGRRVGVSGTGVMRWPPALSQSKFGKIMRLRALLARTARRRQVRVAAVRRRASRGRSRRSPGRSGRTGAGSGRSRSAVAVGDGVGERAAPLAMKSAVSRWWYSRNCRTGLSSRGTAAARASSGSVPSRRLRSAGRPGLRRRDQRVEVAERCGAGPAPARARRAASGRRSWSAGPQVAGSAGRVACENVSRRGERRACDSSRNVGKIWNVSASASFWRPRRVERLPGES